jgi:hypothetical protein
LRVNRRDVINNGAIANGIHHNESRTGYREMANTQGTKGAGPANRRFTRGGGVPADWGHVDAELIRAVIVAAGMAGGAVRFGYTGDGGAYALGIYGDGEKPYTEYVSPRDDIEGVLRSLETVFLDIEAESRSKAKKQP